jgi:hypothetical protein
MFCVGSESIRLRIHNKCEKTGNPQSGSALRDAIVAPAGYIRQGWPGLPVVMAGGSARLGVSV